MVLAFCSKSNRLSYSYMHFISTDLIILFISFIVQINLETDVILCYQGDVVLHFETLYVLCCPLLHYDTQQFWCV